MPVRVVDGFEFVEVNEHNREGGFVARRTLEFFFKALVKGSVVIKAGEAVGARQVTQLSRLLFDEGVDCLARRLVNGEADAAADGHSEVVPREFRHMLAQEKKDVLAQKLELPHEFSHVEALACPFASVKGGAANLLMLYLAIV